MEKKKESIHAILYMNANIGGEVFDKEELDSDDDWNVGECEDSEIDDMNTDEKLKKKKRKKEFAMRDGVLGGSNDKKTIEKASKAQGRRLSSKRSTYVSTWSHKKNVDCWEYSAYSFAKDFVYRALARCDPSSVQVFIGLVDLYAPGESLTRYSAIWSWLVGYLRVLGLVWLVYGLF